MGSKSPDGYRRGPNGKQIVVTEILVVHRSDILGQASHGPISTTNPGPKPAAASGLVEGVLEAADEDEDDDDDEKVASNLNEVAEKFTSGK